MAAIHGTRRGDAGAIQPAELAATAADVAPADATAADVTPADVTPVGVAPVGVAPVGVAPVDMLDVLGTWRDAVELPPYSVWRRIPEWEPCGMWLRDRPQVEWPDTIFPITKARWLMRLLLLVGLALGQTTMAGGAVPRLLAAGLTLVLWGWIEWWQTWDLTPLGKRVLALGGQAALTGLIIAISPLGGLIVWSQYMICGTFFTGPPLLVALAGSSVLITAVQVGGYHLIPNNWALSGGLFALNIAIGIVSIGLANKREEAVMRRNAVTNRLLVEQQRNAALQEQLMDQARTAGMRDERARLARDLHDTVAQGLVAVVTQLEAIDENGLADDATRRRVDSAKALARQGLGEARRAVNALRPTALDDAELPDAIGTVLDEWSRVHRIAGHLTVSGDPRPIPADPTLIRVTQEALSNAARHSGAHRVAVSIDYLDDQVLLDIHDDGRGFDPQATGAPSPTGGHGLPGMADRVRLSGGTLIVESEPGAGCVVSVAVRG